MLIRSDKACTAILCIYTFFYVVKVIRTAALNILKKTFYVTMCYNIKLKCPDTDQFYLKGKISMSKFKYVFFDLDGTLIDTVPLILESFNYTFMHHFGATRPQEETISYIGVPLINHFKEIYPGKEEELVKTYREYNERNHDKSIGIFIGIYNLVKTLYDNGIVLGVVTSKRQELAMRGLRIFNLLDYFMFVNGCEASAKHKPDGDPLIKAMEKVNAQNKNDVLYVGDSPLDILCAKNAGVKSAAVAWTYSPIAELKKVEPDIFIEKPIDLLKHVL